MLRFLRVYTIAALLALGACSAVDPDPEAHRDARPYEFSGPDARTVRHVIHLSIDGLRPEAITRHAVANLPSFYRLRSEGAFTDNARTDPNFRVTLPNHVAQLTGRPVRGHRGHGWTSNAPPEPGVTLHSHRGHYVSSVFDVAHDHGLRTGAYTSKTKFALLEQSYDAKHGAPDETGTDYGRDKIDTFVYDSDTESLVDRFVADALADPFGYVFIHLRDPDSAGHAWGWDLNEASPYMEAVRRVDSLVGRILHLVESDARLSGRTALVVTTDHGGNGYHHDADRLANFAIPFYVWGPGVPAADLYVLNAGRVSDPGKTQPRTEERLVPLRNGAAANLGLSLLGLDPVPGSSLGLSADDWPSFGPGPP